MIKIQGLGDLVKSFIGYFWGNDENWITDNKPIKYVVAKSGLYEIRETEILQAVAKPKEVKGIDMDLIEGIQMKTPKIPYQLYYKALKFLRAVYVRDSTEATIHFFWNREAQEYFLWVPKQKNGGASSNYERDKDEEFTALCNEHAWVMTAHSHPNFAGSFSSIDDADEKDTRLFMVVGHILRDQQDIAIRTCVNKTHVNLSFSDVFTTPMDNIDSVPSEWMDRCTKQVYVSKYAKGGTYANNGYYGSSRYDEYGYDEDYSYGGYQTYKGGAVVPYEGKEKKSEVDEIFEDIDEKYSRYIYNDPIGMDEELDEAYFNALEKDDYSDDPSVVNSLIVKQIESEERRKQEVLKRLEQKKLTKTGTKGGPVDSKKNKHKGGCK